MKFEEAAAIAYSVSEQFRNHCENVAKAIALGERSACLIFSVGSGVYSYGFDGVDVHKIKHCGARAAKLLERGETLVIR